MTFFADLEPCTYFFQGTESRLKAVGWLEHGHPFTTGSVSAGFRSKLEELVRSPWMPVFFMGPHFCTICKAKDPALRHGAAYNAFIPGNGFLYVAPQLIVHYIDDHAYAPPEEFVRAVLACPPMESPEYMAAVQKNGPSFELSGKKTMNPGGS
jgi:hypothetical protein